MELIKVEKIDSEKDDETWKKLELKPFNILETTFRKLIKDYIYHRQKYQKKMIWGTSYFDSDIIIHLEEKPNSQESAGYELINKFE